MTKKSIVLYLHVHQPFRVKYYNIFEAGSNHNYFDAPDGNRTNNRDILDKVSEKSYLPTNAKLLQLLNEHPEFKISMSITGTVLEQMELYRPDVLASFVELCATGRVEIVGETYHHSLAFFYSREEFEVQVQMHRDIIKRIFNQEPKVFRNTEFAYNNDLAYWADKAGYKAILAEGWDKVLGWRSPNFVYNPTYTDNIKLLLKNYKLSDDIAFRFGNKSWSQWPLTADKFTHWLNSTGDDAQIFNLFMDYETFGEHQWSESGIFDFLAHLPAQWFKKSGNSFMTVSEAADSYPAVDRVDMPNTVTWADTERDLSAWTGNRMQQQSLDALYGLEERVKMSGDLKLIEDWRKLTTSDHSYYMCTKYFNDGDVHAYFSPYVSPYEGFMNFMNAWQDVRYRLLEKGIEV
jgi:alpha-amylase